MSVSVSDTNEFQPADESVSTESPDGSETGLISIGRLAKELGVSSRTIRYYEELGILPVPARSPGGTRRYPPEYRFYIEGALALKELGFSLEEIKLLGQLALDRPVSKEERHLALDVVRDKMTGLEHKIKVLGRLRKVLMETNPTSSPAVVVLADHAEAMRNG